MEEVCEAGFSKQCASASDASKANCLSRASERASGAVPSFFTTVLEGFRVTLLRRAVEISAGDEPAAGSPLLRTERELRLRRAEIQNR
ncbi:hypothetical protein [Nocardia xishanensis]|uniref:hypothetical protein n=1 Tax=Nocardia xishanensis TaxID=238964 RepID=UPI0033F83306